MNENTRLAEPNWLVVPRGDVAPHWSHLYVTMNKKGAIVIGRRAHERIGAPEAVHLMIDPVNHRLRILSAKPGKKNSYPLRKHGTRGSRVVRAYRLLTDFGIRPPDTIEFISPGLDGEGGLIVDLRSVRISPRAHSQCRNAEPL